MKNNKKDTNSGARKVLAWIPYILIPVLIISGVSLYARQQKKEKLEYYQVVQYFDDKKVTEYDLNMSSGALEFKLKGDNKVYTYTVPNVSMFQEDIHNGVIAYNRAHPDAPIKAQYETGSTGALLLNIVPRGQMGGYTMYLPTEDKSYHSKNEMLDNLVSLLGGRVAEALIIGDVSTGASNDIERATDIARKMVTKYGMSEKLGPITFGSGNDEVFLGRDYSHLKNYSEETAAEIDEEINHIITTAYGRTEDILKEHIDRLHAVAGALIEREKISGEEFETIMHGGTLDPLSAQSDDSKPAEVPEQSDAQNNEEADGNEKESE